MWKYFLLFCCFASKISADVPVHCLYEEVRGKWTFHIGQRGFNEHIDCSTMGDVKSTYKVELKYPNVVVDEFDNKGTWTMTRDQGFEVIIHGRKFFAFSNYVENNGKFTSLCSETLPGWTHDVFGRDWACYYGKKDEVQKKPSQLLEALQNRKTIQTNTPNKEEEKKLYKNDLSMIKKINNDRSLLWKAKKYEEFEKLTIRDIRRMSGGNSDVLAPEPAPASPLVKQLSSQLPEEFDWRNTSGENYVPPVRDQGSCGSCYAFASLGMNEIRLRVASKNTLKVKLAPQDVLDCSPYSQGCEGGFSYMVGGKYSEDYGLVTEDCSPYKATEFKCSPEKRSQCKRYYFTDYEYIGGYYGACNEDLMKIALVNNGPLSVGYRIYSDFRSYAGGIYEHTNLQSKYDPYQPTSHAVVIVGYGVDKPTGKKFWIVRNSWGEKWGEQGYFRIARGQNECAIESNAVQAFPIF